MNNHPFFPLDASERNKLTIPIYIFFECLIVLDTKFEQARIILQSS
jgi:hypothetical protein